MVSDAVTTPEPGTEEFAQAVEAEFAEPPQEPPTDAGVAEQAEQPEEEAPQPVPEEPSPEAVPEAAVEDDYVDVAGVRLPNDKAQAVAEFWNWSQSPQGQPWMYAMHQLVEKGI